MDGMHPHERLPYSAIVDRPPLQAPPGARMIVYPLMALEVWDISRAMARMVLPPPQGVPMIPDHPNWTWHEYGMRVGFWRVKKVLDDLRLPVTVSLNARVCLDYPRVVEGCLESGWELNAHSFEQMPMHKLEDERATIQKSMEIIGKAWGRKVRGWSGPGLTQTYKTADYLAEAGLEYILDWVLDDEPFDIKTRYGTIVGVPYNYELHDIVLFALQHQMSDAYFQRALDQFETLYAESFHRPKVMSIAMHPYLVGQPHRIKYFRKIWEHIAAQPGVVVWSCEQVLDWYLGVRENRAPQRQAAE